MRATTFANFNLSVTTMSTELVRDPRSSFSRWHGFLRLYPLALHRCQPQYPITASWFRSFPKRRSGQPSLSTSAPGPCPVALCSSDSGLRRLDQQFARRVGLRTEAQGTQLSTQGTQLSIRCGRRWGGIFGNLGMGIAVNLADLGSVQNRHLVVPRWNPSHIEVLD